MDRREAVKQAAADLGFSSCGITDLTPPPHAEALDRWLKAGMAGSMGYMPRQATKRKNPSLIVEGATRAVMVTRAYTPDDGSATSDGRGRIASYARGPDYHDTLEKPLAALADRIREIGGGGEDIIARPYVDAGPVPERELAQRAGLGWIGKNTMLIHPERGSFFFIASVLTNVDLPLDEPFTADRCGSCRACLDACPTAAFPGERQLDATKCISYLTIEWKGALDDWSPETFQQWVFGCDICQTVCPWNIKFAEPVEDPQLNLTGAATVDLRELADMPDDVFEERFGHSPLSRPGAAGMRRNAALLLKGSG